MLCKKKYVSNIGNNTGSYKLGQTLEMKETSFTTSFPTNPDD